MKAENKTTKKATLEFLKLSDSWHGPETAKELASKIRSERTKNKIRDFSKIFD